MSESTELIVAGIGGSGAKSTSVSFTLTDKGVRPWAWIKTSIVAEHNIRAGVTLTVSDVRAFGNVQTEYENENGELVQLDKPKQQLLLGGKMTIKQPEFEPLAQLEVVSV